MLMPGLPDDIAGDCLARIPRIFHSDLRRVSWAWRAFIESDELKAFRKPSEEEVVFAFRKRSWEILDSWGRKIADVPPPPGPVKAGFGAVVIGHKLLVLGGYSVTGRVFTPSADVYEFDACLSRWRKLPDMSLPRYNFACAEVEGKVYAAGGYDKDGSRLSTGEMYDPGSETWTSAAPFHCPRALTSAFSFKGQLYLIKNRLISGTGRSCHIDVYNQEKGMWRFRVGDGFRVNSHALVGSRVFCIDWDNPSWMLMLDPEDGSWELVMVPLIGDAGSVRYVLGSIRKSLLLVPREDGYGAWLYHPHAPEDSRWESTDIDLSGCTCLHTMKV